MTRLILPLLLALANQFAALSSPDPAGYTGNRRQRREVDVDKMLPTFDAKLQKISVSGEHKFKPPGPNDARGPCPGLNVLANHGYLPRNGIATIPQFVGGVNGVYGMGLDMATTLATYGAVMCGDLKSWSIGGPMPQLQSPVPGILGRPMGITWSHNKYESDGSATRRDLWFRPHDPASVRMEQFVDMYERGTEYTMELLNKFSSDRFDNSLNNNPYFFLGPFATLVRLIEYFFIHRLFKNHSAERPEGFLDRPTLKSFFAIYGSDGNFIAKPGHEQIPKNWYRRPLTDPYDNAHFAVDMVNWVTVYPKFLSIGGNTGKPNTFVGVDVGNLTGGAYNAKTLLEGNNAVCFFYNALLVGVPDILRSPLLAGFPSPFNSTIGDFLSTLGCPQLAKFDMSLFQQFPGHTKLKDDGTFPE